MTVNVATSRPVRRYRAFISYSHRDEQVARKLQRDLEKFTPPKALTQRTSHQGHPLTPIFRDRTELRAASDLSSEIEHALAGSDALIVIGSPDAAKSHWVNRELEYFKGLEGARPVLYYIAERTDSADVALAELLPPAAFVAYNRQGQVLADQRLEPLAADARKMADGRKSANLKVVASLLDVDFDALAQRENRRRQRRLFAITSSAVAVAVITAALAITALWQSQIAQQQRSVALSEAANAQVTIDFLTSLFQVSASKATNPENVSALSLLQEGAAQLHNDKLKPSTRAQFALVVGESFANLGVYDEAVQLLQPAIATQPANSKAGAALRITLADALTRLGQFEQAQPVLDTVDAYRRAQADYPNAADLRLLQTQAVWRYYTGDDLGAINRYEVALQVAQQQPDRHEDDIARYTANLAGVYRQLGRIDQALVHYQEAANRYRTLNNNPLDLANTLIGLAETLSTMGDNRQALTQLQLAFELLQPTVPQEHPVRILALLNRAQIYNQLQQFELALADLAGAKHQIAALHDDDHMLASEVFASQADALIGLKQMAQAQLKFEQALGIITNTVGERNMLLVEHLILQADIWAQHQQPTQRNRACKRANDLLHMGNFTDGEPPTSLYDSWQKTCQYSHQQ